MENKGVKTDSFKIKEEDNISSWGSIKSQSILYRAMFSFERASPTVKGANCKAMVPQEPSREESLSDTSVPGHFFTALLRSIGVLVAGVF